MAGTACGTAAPVEVEAAEADERTDEAALLNELRTELKLDAALPEAVARAPDALDARLEIDESAEDWPDAMEERRELTPDEAEAMTDEATLTGF